MQPDVCVIKAFIYKRTWLTVPGTVLRLLRCWGEVLNLGTNQTGAGTAEAQPEEAEDHLQLHHRWVRGSQSVLGAVLHSLLSQSDK